MDTRSGPPPPAPGRVPVCAHCGRVAEDCPPPPPDRAASGPLVYALRIAAWRPASCWVESIGGAWTSRHMQPACWPEEYTPPTDQPGQLAGPTLDTGPAARLADGILGIVRRALGDRRMDGDLDVAAALPRPRATERILRALRPYVEEAARANTREGLCPPNAPLYLHDRLPLGYLLTITTYLGDPALAYTVSARFGRPDTGESLSARVLISRVLAAELGAPVVLATARADLERQMAFTTGMTPFMLYEERRTVRPRPDAALALRYALDVPPPGPPRPQP